jgi:very-short-patch-repair endonuclease
MDGKPLPRGLELATLAAQQHGVVSIRQLRRLGFSESSAEKGVTTGRLHRLHRGVYAVGHTNLSLKGWCLGAVLASGPRSLLSHYSAGWLLGLISTRPIPIHVTTPLPRKRRGSIRLHHSRTLVEEDLSRSEFEREFAAGAEQCGLPRFATNFNAAGYELDVYWPDLRFGVELDVYATHGAPEPFEEDRRRAEDLKLAGVELTRVTAYRFEHEPRQVMERVGRLLSQRRQQVGAGVW